MRKGKRWGNAVTQNIYGHVHISFIPNLTTDWTMPAYNLKRRKATGREHHKIISIDKKTIFTGKTKFPTPTCSLLRW
jgi:hypothetical protein